MRRAYVCGTFDTLNRMEGEVRLLIPAGGVPVIVVPGLVFHDPEPDGALFDTLCARVVITDRRQVQRLSFAMHDPAFANALANSFRAFA